METFVAVSVETLDAESADMSVEMSAVVSAEMSMDVVSADMSAEMSVAVSTAMLDVDVELLFMEMYMALL